MVNRTSLNYPMNCQSGLIFWHCDQLSKYENATRYQTLKTTLLSLSSEVFASTADPTEPGYFVITGVPERVLLHTYLMELGRSYQVHEIYYIPEGSTTVTVSTPGNVGTPSEIYSNQFTLAAIRDVYRV